MLARRHCFGLSGLWAVGACGDGVTLPDAEPTKTGVVGMLGFAVRKTDTAAVFAAA